MAHSSVDARKTPLHINAFWEKATIASARSWEKWTQQWNFALLADEGIQNDVISKGPPSVVICPPELVYEEPAQNHTQATERDEIFATKSLK